MLSGIDSPSTRHRFRHTRTLSIEYPNEVSEPVYEGPPIEGGGIVSESVGKFAPGGEWGDIALKVAQEMIKLKRCLKEAGSLGMKALFPSLHSVSVSPTYRVGAGWQDEDSLGGFRAFSFSARSDCRIALEAFLSTGPALRRICTRDTSGPLSLPRQNLARRTPPLNSQFERIIHLGNENALPSALPLALPLTILGEYPPSKDWVEICEYMQDELSKMAELHSSAKLKIYVSTTNYSGPRSGEMSTIFDPVGLNTPAEDLPRSPLSMKEQRGLAEILTQSMQVQFRSSDKPDEAIKWSVSADIPICPCCGASAPE